MPETIDIGLLEYPGAQEAALFGLTDLFEIANRPDRPRLKVTRWRAEDNHLVAINESRAPSAMIIPSGKLGPVTAAIAQEFGPGLRDLHAAGTTLASVAGCRPRSGFRPCPCAERVPSKGPHHKAAFQGDCPGIARFADANTSAF